MCLKQDFVQTNQPTAVKVGQENPDLGIQQLSNLFLFKLYSAWKPERPYCVYFVDETGAGALVIPFRAAAPGTGTNGAAQWVWFTPPCQVPVLAIPLEIPEVSLPCTCPCVCRVVVVSEANLPTLGQLGQS